MASYSVPMGHSYVVTAVQTEVQCIFNHGKSHQHPSNWMCRFQCFLLLKEGTQKCNHSKSHQQLDVSLPPVSVFPAAKRRDPKVQPQQVLSATGCVTSTSVSGFSGLNISLSIALSKWHLHMTVTLDVVSERP